MYIDIEIYRGDDNIFVAACPELNLFSHAKTQDEAVEKLKKDIMEFMAKTDASNNTEKDIEFSVAHYSSRRTQIH